MRRGLLCMVFASSLCACGSYPSRGPDYFSEQAEFSAQRARETIVLQNISYEAVMVHVTEALMDLDCTLQESNRLFGVISARGSARMIQQDTWHAPVLWYGCAGTRVTVTVSPRANRDMAIRASFYPASPEADQAFRTLLRGSVAIKTPGSSS